MDCASKTAKTTAVINPTRLPEDLLPEDLPLVSSWFSPLPGPSGLLIEGHIVLLAIENDLPDLAGKLRSLVRAGVSRHLSWSCTLDFCVTSNVKVKVVGEV